MCYNYNSLFLGQYNDTDEDDTSWDLDSLYSNGSDDGELGAGYSDHVKLKTIKLIFSATTLSTNLSLWSKRKDLLARNHNVSKQSDISTQRLLFQ
jgi:hypothetical protein